jgi:ATP-dependent Lon protease
VLFGDPAHLRKLALAAGDLAWLLGRRYAPKAALTLVGNRYQLHQRQRRALAHAVASPEVARQRGQHRITPLALAGQRLQVDALNQIITIEVALAGGLLLRGHDRVWRDLASVHGTYRTVQETNVALEAIGGYLTPLGVSDVVFLMFETGTIGSIQHVSRGPDNTLQIVVQGIERFRIEQWLDPTPYLRARIAVAPDMVESDTETEALQRSLRDLTHDVLELTPQVPKEVRDFLTQVQDPRYLAYLVAANARLELKDGQQLLEADHVKDKFRILIAHLTHEKEVLALGHKIQSEAREEMDKAQREYYLRQQLKAIQRELGEGDETQALVDEYRQKIEAAGLPEEARAEALRELQRLEGMHPQAAEHAVIKTYLDWVVGLPWITLSPDQLDITHARTVLDEDHYDLQEVKDRIIEYLAVRQLRAERNSSQGTPPTAAGRDAQGAILCFAGPPGVGKTSLGQSIARALGRQFTRMSLGGMRDEAEIRGHRRTYIGAMPGRIIQAIKRTGTRNPVFMLDEVDKVGSDWRGDPSSALLEVLDPAQNHAFRDHYLDVDFDLRDVIFITTANQLDTIPEPLRDRMEILQLDGYTEYEKVRIAQTYLVPRVSAKPMGLT